jgi:hypothetical protein
MAAKDLYIGILDFRAASVRSGLDWKHDAKANQDALGRLLRNDLAPHLQPQPLPHPLRQRQSPPRVHVNDFGHEFSISYFLN